MSGLKRAFVEANLMRNPFGEPPPDERAGLVVQRLAVPGPGEKLQVVGDAGAGKTSALLALRGALEAMGRPAAYAWTPPEGDLAIPEGDTVLLVDEAQRLRDKTPLRRALEGPRTVVVATHEVVAPGVPVLRLEPPGVGFLDEVVGRRLAWARRGPGEVPRPPRELLEELLAKHVGDLRAIEHALYFWYQQRWG